MTASARPLGPNVNALMSKPSAVPPRLKPFGMRRVRKSLDGRHREYRE